MLDERNAARFWAKVEVRAADECWPWRAAKDVHGYGRFHAIPERSLLAHRVAYVLTVGAIPEGFTLDHVRARGCTRRDCCNPAHLEMVTPAENKRRGNSPAAVNARKTHCKRGHELAGDNIYITKQGWRYCQTCQRLRDQRRRNRAHVLNDPL
jgi:hypothetical protein